MHKKAIGTIARMFDNQCPATFVNSLVQTALYSQQVLCRPNEYIHYSWGRVSDHRLGRNQLADEMLGDWIYFTDGDHVFAPDVLERLLRIKRKHNCRVLSGIYQFKFQPHSPVANTWGPNGEIQPLINWDPDVECMEIGPCGAGCLLVDRSVFVEIENKLGHKPFDSYGHLSEDYGFFARCRDLGIKTYLAPKVESHHTTSPIVLHLKDYLKSKEGLDVTVA